MSVKTIVLLLLALVAGVFLIYNLFFKSSGLSLDEIAAKVGMDCSATTIDPDRELLEVNISRVLEDPTFACEWNGSTYEVGSRDDLDRLAQALLPKMPKAANRGADQLVEDCRELIYSASIDSLTAEQLVVTTNYAFVNQSGLGGIKEAMADKGVDVKTNPSACGEFIAWHEDQS